MQTDPALQALRPYLQNLQHACLWFADEQVMELLPALRPSSQLTIVTNRFDIFQQAQQGQFKVIFSDFDQAEYTGKYERIIYRVSKEKALIHHLLYQASQLLADEGQLILTGFKQEGIKSIGKHLEQNYQSQGKLKKYGRFYLGEFTHLKAAKEDGSHYRQLQKIPTKTTRPAFFYSKPGVYGWQKVDKGSALLLATLDEQLAKADTDDKTVLDLGCGYGWLFLNLDDYGFASIDATDNNSAALICATHNAATMNTKVTIFASDCADNTDKQFDFIVCNPPFHQGFKHSQGLTDKFIAACAEKLNIKGLAFLVVNEFIHLEDLAKKYQLSVQLLRKEAGFKVLSLQRLS